MVGVGDGDGDGYYRLLLQSISADSGSLTSVRAATIGVIATGALPPLANGCFGPSVVRSLA